MATGFEIACPYLPPGRNDLTWRDLNRWRNDQGPEFYETALAYGQTLWARGLTARSLLAVDRGLYADLTGDESVLIPWPWPYAAIGWLVASNPVGTFMGNPRVHYQHLADRVRGERGAQKKWRAWAAWAVVRRAAPGLGADPKHAVEEPTKTDVADGLFAHGARGELAIWREAMAQF